MPTSSTFYSTYDVRQLVINDSYKGIEFDLGGGGTEFSIEEVSLASILGLPINRVVI